MWFVFVLLLSSRLVVSEACAEKCQEKSVIYQKQVHTALVTPSIFTSSIGAGGSSYPTRHHWRSCFYHRCTIHLEQLVEGGAVGHIAACVSASPEARTVQALFRPEAIRVTDHLFSVSWPWSLTTLRHDHDSHSCLLYCYRVFLYVIRLFVLLHRNLWLMAISGTLNGRSY